MDREALLALLPEHRVGTVRAIEPLTLGLSGAGVYAVTTSRGDCVLRVQARELAARAFEQQLRIVDRAAAAGVAPAVLHVDEAARAVVSERVQGLPLAAALANPAQQSFALESTVDQLRRLHTLDVAGVDERDPVTYARAAFDAARARPGFPPWAASLGAALDESERALRRDPRRVVSHNDVNPGNLVWDGARAWLVDWEVAGLGHPYYDLAVLAMFLRFDDERSFHFAARHDGAPLDETGRATFRDLRRLASALCGLTFLGLVDDLRVREAPAIGDVPSLGDVYDGMRTGALDLRTPYGRASMALALLAQGAAS